MIKKEYRLKKNRQFKYIYKHGESKSHQKLLLIFVKTKQQPFKVGFSVSKKVGKSVVRSKVKRRLRACFAKLIASVDNNYNYIFVAKEGIADMSFDELLLSMKELLIKAEKFNDIN